MEIEIKKFSNVVCLIIFREENRKPMIISALHSGHCFHHYYPIRYCQKFIGCNAMQVWNMEISIALFEGKRMPLKFTMHCQAQLTAPTRPCTCQHIKRNIISINDTMPVLN